MGCVGSTLHQEKHQLSLMSADGEFPLQVLKGTQEESNMGSGKRDQETCALDQLRYSLAGTQECWTQYLKSIPGLSSCHCLRLSNMYTFYKDTGI